MRNLTFFIVFLALTSTTAQAGVKTATDKIVDSFMTLDGDDTSSVSFGEYMGMVKQKARKRFANMDRNHDGEVTADEYRSFWGREKSKYYRLKK